MKKADVAEFYRRLADRIPAPETELQSVNTYTLLVAVVLSAQATDAGVNSATRDLFAKVTTPAQMLALGEDGLKRHIKTIGLFNMKAKNVIALSAGADRPLWRRGARRPRRAADACPASAARPPMW